MSRIDIGEIRTFALQLKEANQQGKRCIKAIQTVVTNYTEEDSLKGKAIDASKNYYQMTYVPLCKAILEVMEESQERLRQYMDDFHDQVDSSPNARIDEEGLFELGQQIDRLEAKKETLAQRMNVGTEGQMQIYRSQLSKAYKKENIVEKYLAFEQSHTDFFAHISDLVQNIQQTIRELQSNIQFNHHTGTYDLTKLDLDTVSRLQQALGKETNTQPKKFPFNEYQKTYTGTTWILTRGGIIDVEATTAYNEAILHGELPPESNQATEDAELLKGIIASVKAGKDPLTGQEISLLQGISIIAGTTFMYTAGAYHGKRMGIPKLKSVLRRKKAGGGNVPKSSKNSAQYLKYKNELMKGDILKNSKPIISGSDLKDSKVVSELTKDGSSISDWSKMESTYSYETSMGKGKIHYYQNLKTGEINFYDVKMKVKIPKDLKIRNELTDDFWIIDLDNNFIPMGVR
ncbi:hypothetical protein HB853_09360 [Listeria welshimeri]|uniref:LXG domain-containing protein n=1 Tax=Listeria welshimeri TaxID=1643 RepID=A0A7X0T6F7_LISWE|nr:hypothetical protein [Listeria welshimeri]